MTSETSNEAPDIDINRVMEILPHRYPFLMIDKVINVKLDESATGIKNVTINEPFFQGHFPSAPVMPGVMMVEAMAQTAGVLVMETLGRTGDALVYFMTVENARFRKPVGPGDVLEIDVKKQRNKRNVWKFEGQAKVEGKVVAEAVFSAMIVDQE